MNASDAAATAVKNFIILMYFGLTAAKIISFLRNLSFRIRHDSYGSASSMSIAWTLNMVVTLSPLTKYRIS